MLVVYSTKVKLTLNVEDRPDAFPAKTLSCYMAYYLIVCRSGAIAN